MRQSGVLAAAGLYALDHHIDQLAEDNANASRLAQALAGVPGLTFEPEAGQSNILSFSVAGLGIPAATFADGCLAEGVRVRAIGSEQIRATTHLDVDRAGIDRAAAVIRAEAERIAGGRR